MTVEHAIYIFNKKYPDKKLIGYWKDGGNYILNTEDKYGPGYSGEICQFLVSGNGDIQPTNPMRSEVIIDSPMIKIY